VYVAQVYQNCRKFRFARDALGVHGDVLEDSREYPAEGKNVLLLTVNRQQQETDATSHGCVCKSLINFDPDANSASSVGAMQQASCYRC
jgi:hypothetical protein